MKDYLLLFIALIFSINIYADEFETEPNNSKQDADPIYNNIPVNGNISTVKDDDWYFFNTTRNDVLTIESNTTSIKVSVYDSENNLLYKDDDRYDDPIKVGISKKGMYFIKIENSFAHEPNYNIKINLENIDPNLNPTGLWYDPELNGLGFNLIKSENGLFIYYYGYSIDGKRLWLSSGKGPKIINKGDIYTLSMYEGGDENGANFNTKPTNGSGIVDWGTITVKLDSCSTGVITLNGNDGVQEFNVIKLVNIDELVCTDK